nr:hypothetical protein [Tanacetum cinerariifolium]GEY88391.1 hypothetical protein [Tanacetum cinerariifolium]
MLNERKLQIQECMVQKVKASDASSGEKDCSRIVSDKENDQGLENQSNTSGDERNRSRNECNDKITSGDDADIRPSYDTKPMVERVVLANLIATLKLDVDENKKIQKQLKKANTSLACELKECKTILAKTSRTLGESNTIRDSFLIALQNKRTELETYKTLNDRTVDYDKLEHKLNETLGLLAQKEIDIKEGLKFKAYEILVVKEKHDELVKQSLLIKSHYEGLVKEKTKTQNDSFKFVHELKQEMHIDLKYVEPVEKEIDELESDKAEFSLMYDILLQECVSNDVTNSLKHVSFQSLREYVGSNDMVHYYYLEEAKKKAQLQKDKALDTKPSVQQSARLPNTTNGNKPRPRNFNQQPRN